MLSGEKNLSTLNPLIYSRILNSSPHKKINYKILWEDKSEWLNSENLHEGGASLKEHRISSERTESKDVSKAEKA